MTPTRNPAVAPPLTVPQLTHKELTTLKETFQRQVQQLTCDLKNFCLLPTSVRPFNNAGPSATSIKARNIRSANDYQEAGQKLKAAFKILKPKIDSKPFIFPHPQAFSELKDPRWLELTQLYDSAQQLLMASIDEQRSASAPSKNTANINNADIQLQKHYRHNVFFVDLITTCEIISCFYQQIYRCLCTQDYVRLSTPQKKFAWLQQIISIEQQIITTHQLARLGYKNHPILFQLVNHEKLSNEALKYCAEQLKNTTRQCHYTALRFCGHYILLTELLTDVNNHALRCSYHPPAVEPAFIQSIRIIIHGYLLDNVQMATSTRKDNTIEWNPSYLITPIVLAILYGELDAIKELTALIGPLHKSKPIRLPALNALIEKTYKCVLCQLPKYMAINLHMELLDKAIHLLKRVDSLSLANENNKRLTPDYTKSILHKALANLCSIQQDMTEEAAAIAQQLIELDQQQKSATNYRNTQPIYSKVMSVDADQTTEPATSASEDQEETPQLPRHSALSQAITEFNDNLKPFADIQTLLSNALTESDLTERDKIDLTYTLLDLNRFALEARVSDVKKQLAELETYKTNLSNDIDDIITTPNTKPSTTAEQGKQFINTLKLLPHQVNNINTHLNNINNKLNTIQWDDLTAHGFTKEDQDQFGILRTGLKHLINGCLGLEEPLSDVANIYALRGEFLRRFHPASVRSTSPGNPAAISSNLFCQQSLQELDNHKTGMTSLCDNILNYTQSKWLISNK